MTQPSAEQLRVAAVIRDFAADQGLELEAGRRDGEYVLTLPGEKKLKTACSLLVGDRELSVSAFVIRHPDENHEAFFRYLLSRNLRTPGLAFAVDRLDDVYVVGRLPLTSVDEDQLDRLMGVVLESADGTFNELLVLGFLTSMRHEWAWRVLRGESLRNLEAFRPLLEDARFEGDAVTEAPSLAAHLPSAEAAPQPD